MNRYKNDKADETRMIRFIDPNYRELFQIPDGAYVEVKYPNSTVIVACGCMDEYHLRFGSASGTMPGNLCSGAGDYGR